MAAFSRGKLFFPLWTQCRHRGKVNIQHPKPGPLPRRILAAITEPFYKEEFDKSHFKECSVMKEKLKKKVVQEENMFEQFLIRECRKIFEENRLLMVCQPVPLKANDIRLLRNKFINNGMQIAYDFPTSVIQQAISGTKWENMSQLFIGHELLIISNDDCMDRLVRLARKTPEFLLLGGVFDDRMYSVSSLQNYADLPDLHSLQGQTVATLNSALSKTQHLLNHHQQKLVHNLDMLAKESQCDAQNNSTQS